MTRLTEIHVEESDGVPVARLAGELDLSNVQDVGDALVSAVGADAAGLVVDMTGLRHIDSAGLRMLFDLRRRLGHRRQELALVVPAGARIRDVLELAAVGDAVPLFAELAAACDAVRGG